MRTSHYVELRVVDFATFPVNISMYVVNVRSNKFHVRRSRNNLQISNERELNIFKKIKNMIFILIYSIII